MARESAAVLSLTCLLAFVLLVVTCCSAPATRAITLFKVVAETGSQEAQLEVGILGFCFATAGGATVSDRSSCSPSSLGFQIIMGTPPIGGSLGVGYSFGSATNGMIAGGANGRVVASADLTRALVLNPLAAAASGLTAILAVAAWASRGNRSMGLVTIVMSTITAALTWIAFAINVAVAAKVKQGVDALQLSIPSGQSLSFVFGAATFLPLGAAVTLSAALGWAALRYMRGSQQPTRRNSASTAVEHGQAWSERKNGSR